MHDLVLYRGLANGQQVVLWEILDSEMAQLVTTPRACVCGDAFSHDVAICI